MVYLFSCTFASFGLSSVTVASLDVVGAFLAIVALDNLPAAALPP